MHVWHTVLFESGCVLPVQAVLAHEPFVVKMLLDAIVEQVSQPVLVALTVVPLAHVACGHVGLIADQ